MTNNKLVVALLIVTILLSAITIGVTVGTHTDNSQQSDVVAVGTGSANVGLTVEQTPANTGASNEEN